MVIGPDGSGWVLDIGGLADDDNDQMIHAVPARPSI